MSLMSGRRPRLQSRGGHAVTVLVGRGGLEAALARARVSTLTRDVILAMGVSLLVGLFRLGTPSIWVDEAATARAVHARYVDLLTDNYHWLYYSIVKPWGLVAGTSEWALRLPSVLGAVLACGLLVVLARRLTDGPTALISGLLLAINPFVIKWSQQARGYTMLLAISLLATLMLVRALERGSRGAWATYGVAFAAATVWHPVAGLFLLPVHALRAFQKKERVLPHGLLALVLICLLAVPWAGQIAIRSTGEGVAMNWLRFPTAEVATRALLDVPGSVGLGLLLAVAGIVLLSRAGSGSLALWLGTWAFSPFALALVVSLVRPIYLDRYLIVAAPAFALLAASALTSFAARARALLVIGLVVATLSGLAQWYSSSSEGNWRGEDWRRAIRTVLDRRFESEAIVVVPWSSAPAAQYYKADVIDVSSANSIWVLTWSEQGDDISPTDRRALGFGDHRRVERLDFGSRVSAQLWSRAP